MHLALMDSTGWGLLNSKAASAGAVIVDECAYVVSPGSSLHGAGQHPYLQVPLVQAVAQEEAGVLAPFFCSHLSNPGHRHQDEGQHCNRFAELEQEVREHDQVS